MIENRMQFVERTEADLFTAQCLVDGKVCRLQGSNLGELKGQVLGQLGQQPGSELDRIDGLFNRISERVRSLEVDG